MSAHTRAERDLVDQVATALKDALPGATIERNVAVGSGVTAGIVMTVPASDRTVTASDNDPLGEYGPVSFPAGELPLAAPAGATRNKATGSNVGRLKGFVERVEKLEEERAAIGSDIRDIYSEAKGSGYDVATLRKVVQLRKMDAADRAEQETLLDVYKHALGMT